VQPEDFPRAPRSSQQGQKRTEIWTGRPQNIPASRQPSRQNPLQTGVPEERLEPSTRDYGFRVSAPTIAGKYWRLGRREAIWTGPRPAPFCRPMRGGTPRLQRRLASMTAPRGKAVRPADRAGSCSSPQARIPALGSIPVRSADRASLRLPVLAGFARAASSSAEALRRRWRSRTCSEAATTQPWPRQASSSSTRPSAPP